LNYITNNNYEIIKEFVKNNGTDIGNNFGVYISEIKNIFVVYTDKSNEENISMTKINDYLFSIFISQGFIKCDYKNIPLDLTKDEKEKKLNNCMKTIILEINKK
jgi:hypothetical protein